MIDPRFESAWSKVSLAGRELGSGPALSGNRIADGVKAWLMERSCPEQNAGAIALGVAVGLVMAEDPAAVAALKQIREEWLANS